MNWRTCSFRRFLQESISRNFLTATSVLYVDTRQVSARSVWRLSDVAAGSSKKDLVEVRGYCACLSTQRKRQSPFSKRGGHFSFVRGAGVAASAEETLESDDERSFVSTPSSRSLPVGNKRPPISTSGNKRARSPSLRANPADARRSARVPSGVPTGLAQPDAIVAVGPFVGPNDARARQTKPNRDATFPS